MSLPSKAAIAAYWSTVPVEWSDGSTAPGEYDVQSCWACDWPIEDCGPLERAHLVPRSLGGSDEPSNLVLLCRSCHRKAPNVDDRDYMLAWVRGYASREARRQWEKASEVGRLLKERLGEENINDAKEVLRSGGWARVSALLDKRASYHFGDGVNPATMAWAIEQVVRDPEAGAPGVEEEAPVPPAPTETYVETCQRLLDRALSDEARDAWGPGWDRVVRQRRRDLEAAKAGAEPPAWWLAKYRPRAAA